MTADTWGARRVKRGARIILLQPAAGLRSAGLASADRQPRPPTPIDHHQFIGPGVPIRDMPIWRFFPKKPLDTSDQSGCGAPREATQTPMANNAHATTMRSSLVTYAPSEQAPSYFQMSQDK